MAAKNSCATDKPAPSSPNGFSPKRHLKAPRLSLGSVAFYSNSSSQATFFHGHLDRSARLKFIARHSCVNHLWNFSTARFGTVGSAFRWLIEAANTTAQLSHRAETAFRKTAKKTIKIGSEKRREKKSKVETDRNAQASGLPRLFIVSLYRPDHLYKEMPANIFTAAQTHQTLSHSRDFEARSLISRRRNHRPRRSGSRAAISAIIASWDSFSDPRRLMRLIQQRFTYKLELRN